MHIRSKPLAIPSTRFLVAERLKKIVIMAVRSKRGKGGLVFRTIRPNNGPKHGGSSDSTYDGYGNFHSSPWRVGRSTGPMRTESNVVCYMMGRIDDRNESESQCTAYVWESVENAPAFFSSMVKDFQSFFCNSSSCR